MPGPTDVVSLADANSFDLDVVTWGTKLHKTLSLSKYITCIFNTIAYLRNRFPAGLNRPLVINNCRSPSVAAANDMPVIVRKTCISGRQIVVKASLNSKAWGPRCLKDAGRIRIT
jgi:hypothetical protein